LGIVEGDVVGNVVDDDKKVLSLKYSVQTPSMI
jgi:hypothetical protein